MSGKEFGTVGELLDFLADKPREMAIENTYGEFVTVVQTEGTGVETILEFD